MLQHATTHWLPGNHRVFLATEWPAARRVRVEAGGRESGAMALRALNQPGAMVSFRDSDESCRLANDTRRRWFGRDSQQMLNIVRNAPTIGGGFKDTPARITPEIVDGMVPGFWVFATDVPPVRERERALRKAIEGRDAAITEIRAREGLLPAHGKCPRCAAHSFPGVEARPVAGSGAEG